MLAERVRELFDLDEERGLLIYLTRGGRPGPSRVGKPAGTPRKKDGRMVILIDGKLYLRSRLIYLHKYGDAPKVVEHRDGDPTNDRLDNLRPATQRENCANADHKPGRSGARGVTWCKTTAMWRVRIGRTEGGRFPTIPEAAAAAEALGRKIYGEFWIGAR